mgnify:CR=1 FL=1
MGIIKQGKVERGIVGTWWLVDGNGNSITRLSGEWVEQYAGRALGIVPLDEEEKPVFEMMAEILDPREGSVPAKERAESMRRQAKTLLMLANQLDPPYPCNRCNVGWGAWSNKEVRNCRGACSRLREWTAKQKEMEHEVAIGDPLHDQELEER